MEKEIWKDVKGFEGHYQISNIGNIKSLKRITRIGHGAKRLTPEKIMKLHVNKVGYVQANLCKGKICRKTSAHRLVAEEFTPNPENKPCVNHKDGNKSNNSVENLEWCTVAENNKHAFDVLNKKLVPYWKGKTGSQNASSKAVLQYNLDGTLIAKHGGLSEAERTTGINHRLISCACRGIQKTSGGYKWEFK